MKLCLQPGWAMVEFDQDSSSSDASAKIVACGRAGHWWLMSRPAFYVGEKVVVKRGDSLSAHNTDGTVSTLVRVSDIAAKFIEK